MFCICVFFLFSYLSINYVLIIRKRNLILEIYYLLKCSSYSIVSFIFNIKSSLCIYNKVNIIFWNFFEKNLQKVLVVRKKALPLHRIWEQCLATRLYEPWLEGWVSGWNHQFAKLTCGLPYRGFESPSFRRARVGRFILKQGASPTNLVDSSNG